MTVEKYLAFEEMSQEKHEYVDGWVYPLFPEIDGMAGGTNNHAALASNAGRLLGNALEDSTHRLSAHVIRIVSHEPHG